MNGKGFNMKENFWRELPRPFFILAPMEDVTDVVFRHVVSEAARPDVFFTEFTNTVSYCHPEGKESVRGRLTFTEDEQPMVAHIWFIEAATIIFTNSYFIKFFTKKTSYIYIHMLHSSYEGLKGGVT